MSMCFMCGSTKPGKKGWHRIFVDGSPRNVHEKCQILFNKSRRTAQAVTNAQGELLLRPESTSTVKFED